MIYVRSEHYRQTRGEAEKPVLFGEKEGRIALANRQQGPALPLCRPGPAPGLSDRSPARPEDSNRMLLPTLQRKIERLETRLKLLEEELRGGHQSGRDSMSTRRTDRGGRRVGRRVGRGFRDLADCSKFRE